MDETDQMRDLSFEQFNGTGPGRLWFADSGRCCIHELNGACTMSSDGGFLAVFPTPVAAATYYRLQHPAPSLP